MRQSLVALSLLGALLFPAAAASAQDDGPFSGCGPDDPRFFRGSRVEPIADRPGATKLVLTGPVSITCNDLTLFADHVTYENDTKHIEATGNVTVQQSDLTIYAERAALSGVTKLGTFYNAVGKASLGSGPPERSQFGTLEPDVIFYGLEVAKTAPKRYRLKNGGFTTCVQPTPRWEMSGSDASIELDRYILMKHMVLRVKDVPLFYVPAIYYPINDEGRSTGFLLPTYGASTIGGTGLSNAFFWAISRNQDATFYHTWNSKLGQDYEAEYRYVTAPGSQGRGSFLMMHEKGLESTVGGVKTKAPGKKSYRLNGGAAQVMPGGFYLSANASYFTDVQTQQRSQNIVDYSRRDRSWGVSLAGTVKRLRIAVVADQTDYFYGNQRGQRGGTMPSVSLALPDRPIGRSRIYYGVSGEAAYLVRQDNLADPRTNRSLTRVNARPTIRAPLSRLPYLSATGSAAWRFTRWQESIDPVSGLQVPVALTRQLLEVEARMTGPVLARVFDTPNSGYSERIKHIIEPTFRISRSSSFREFDRVVKLDYSTDGLVGGTTRIDYRLSNRILVRRRGSAESSNPLQASSLIREIFSVDLSQSYYSNAIASLYDVAYETRGSGTNNFGPLRLEAIARPGEETIGQFKMEIDSKYRKVRSYGATGTIQSTHAQVEAGWSREGVIPQLPGYAADEVTHFLNAATTLRSRENRMGGSYVMNLDVKQKSFLQQRIMAYFNSQCCGISFDWQTISTPYYTIKSDRRFGVSFTLAGLGSFSNPMGAFGGRQ